jgi:hypothetical protein
MWTGIACLVADRSCKDFKRFGEEGKGAYVNIVAWAESAKQFADRVKRSSHEIDCVLLELERVQLLCERMSEPDYPEELITMRGTAQRQQADVIFGAFHTWTQSDVQ